MKKILLALLGFTLSAFSQDAGDLDTTFGQQGFATVSGIEGAHAMAIGADDSIYLTGGANYLPIAKFLPDGTPDLNFGTNGSTIFEVPGADSVTGTCIAVQGDGKILAGGVVLWDAQDHQTILVRMLPDGTPDQEFGVNGLFTFQSAPGPYNYLEAIVPMPEGKILLGGYAGSGNPQNDFFLLKLNPDGSADTTFNESGGIGIDFGGDDRAYCMTVQADEKILIAGRAYPAGQNTSWFAVARLNRDGTPDTTFDADGKITIKLGVGNDSAEAIVQQPDGKILIGGESYVPNSQDFSALRLLENGGLDGTFNGDGKFSGTVLTSTDYPTGMVLQPDGKIVLGGSVSAAPERRIGLMRLTADGVYDNTFSLDGKANYEVPGTNGITTGTMGMQSTGQILICGNLQNDFTVARFYSGTELSTPDFASSTINFYPNPSTGILNFSDNVMRFEIYSIDGKLLLNQDVVAASTELNGLTNGIYVIRLTDFNGNATSKKLSVK